MYRVKVRGIPRILLVIVTLSRYSDVTEKKKKCGRITTATEEDLLLGILQNAHRMLVSNKTIRNRLDKAETKKKPKVEISCCR